MESLPSEIHVLIKIVLGISALSAAGVFTLIGFALKQHKIFVRIKERLDHVWSDYCHKHKIRFVPLENGHEPRGPEITD